MPWITLTADDVATRFAEPELDALRGAALATVDPTDAVLASAVEEVRGYVANCPRNALGEPGAIPARLKSAALSVACWNLLSRLPVASLATPERRQQYEDAVKLLQQVAACKYSVDAPALAESPASSSPPPRPRITARESRPL